MVDFLMFVLCSYGICFGFIQKCEIIYSKISYLEKMSECEYCTGFWAGLISFFLIYGTKLDASWSIIVLGIAHAFAGASLCYLIDTLYKRIEEMPVDFGSEEEGDG